MERAKLKHKQKQKNRKTTSYKTSNATVESLNNDYKLKKLF